VNPRRFAPSLCTATAAFAAAACLAAGAARAESPAPDPALEAALRLQEAFGEVAERVLPSVVGLTVYGPRSASAAPPPQPAWRESDVDLYPGMEPRRSASGFFVSADGYILSVEHPFVDPKTGEAEKLIDAELADGLHLRARVVGREPTLDLAVLKIDVPGNFAPVTIGDADKIRVGNWAIAVGDPEGAAKTFAIGAVSGKPERQCYQDQMTRTLLQAALTVSPEAYGGPLVDIRGAVIGILQPRKSATPGVPSSSERGIEYALPINLAMTIYEPMVARATKRSPWLGISVLELSFRLRKQIEKPPLTGIYIDNVFEPSPASRAGIQVGDVLTEMGGHKILTVADFQQWLYLFGIGETVSLELSRGGRLLHPKVVIEERPSTATTH
jgi:serine protease Do